MKQLSSLLILCLFAFFVSDAFGQVSHGGSPAFYTNSLKSFGTDDTIIEMPPFDVDSLRMEDQVNETSIDRSFRFAHKFYVDIEKGKSGKNYVMADGTKVWQVVIHSKGAYSINVLFSEYHLPEGARLFLYNSDHSHVIGSFTSENNSEEQLLPIRPVAGDEIIVEYTEPADAAFEGKLKIAEVNHDYRDVLRIEPGSDPANSACMPDVLCRRPKDLTRRSEVLLIINGTIKCSGTLLNNTTANKVPYLLTATHCFTSNFTVTNPDYTYLSGSIIAFFNYERPVCGTNMKATENLSLAGAIPVCIIDTTDVALLRLKETPPDYYNPFYAGWNIEYNKTTNTQDFSPFANMHHPNGTVKKTNEYKDNLKLITFEASSYRFYPNSHWKVTGWTVGSTAAGSSGSGLFDREGMLVGGLSGGNSFCDGTISDNNPDYFFSLAKSWNFTPTFGTQTLHQLLDPINAGTTLLFGFDPYAWNPIIRLSNANYNEGDLLANDTLNTSGTGYVFGNSTLKTVEFAEEFKVNGETIVLGTYLLMPKTDLNSVSEIKIIVYKGNEKPEEELFQTTFVPEYADYNRQTGTVNQKPRTLSVPTENFIRFGQKINVNGKFFIAYKIVESTANKFSIYNSKLSSGKPNTAWIKDPSRGWIKATDYSYQSLSPTSLALQPLVRNYFGDGINASVPGKQAISYDRETHRLQIDLEANESGTVFLYSVTGLLVKKMTYSQGTSIYLPALSKGSIGIVKFISDKNTCSGKIVF